MVGAPLADRKLIYPHLSHVFLCLNDGPTVRNMLTWLNLPSLTTLTIPGGDFSAHNDQTQTDEIANAFWTDHIKDILEENPTITKLTLLNAWKIRMDVLNILSSDLEGKYSGKDLILCTKDWISHSLQGTRSIAPLIYGLRNAQIPNRWGSKIQRVKLLDSRPWMDFDCIEPSFLHSIRILVLHQNTEQTVNTEPLDTFAEGKLATTMASHMPALKLLVFREYIFWIQHLDPLEKPLDRPLDASELQDIQDGEEKQEETFKIWYLKEARRDPEQARAITENLSAEDWQFIDHDPTIIPAESNYEGRFDPARNKIDTNLVVFYKTAKEDHCNA